MNFRLSNHACHVAGAGDDDWGFSLLINHSSRTVPLNSSHFALDMSSMLRKKPSADVGGGVEESLGELLFLFNEMSILRPSRSREYLPLFLAWKM